MTDEIFSSFPFFNLADLSEQFVLVCQMSPPFGSPHILNGPPFNFMAWLPPMEGQDGTTLSLFDKKKMCAYYFCSFTHGKKLDRLNIKIEQ